MVTSLRRNIENEHSQDPEQWQWGLLARGLDHSDFIAAMAPRPVLLVGQEGDYFDARGFEEACARLRHLYTLLGAEQNFSFFLGTGPHSFPKPNREAMYAWFNRHTGLGRIVQSPQIIHIPDLRDSQSYRERDPLQVATVELAGARSLLDHGPDPFGQIATSTDFAVEQPNTTSPRHADPCASWMDRIESALWMNHAVQNR